MQYKFLRTPINKNERNDVIYRAYKDGWKVIKSIESKEMQHCHLLLVKEEKT